ncbi:MAG: WYL domain-containing protein [Proteobacteria bacterium]|nr:MAG: WYL domain-containing protein [Pseudomonadota bacterium]PIE40316.1 MAG: WYL domain-containing protein [Gammaproteobacteria bacterium]
MESFLRRLTILEFLSSSRQMKSTREIVTHLVNAGYINDDNLDEKSLLRIVQRDLKFLLGDTLEDDEPDNIFGLESVRGQGKSLYWRLEPYSGLRFDFEKMPRFMALAFTLTRKHLGDILPRNTVTELNRFFAQAEDRLRESEKSLTPRSYQRLSNAIEFFQRGQKLQAAAFDMEALDTIYRAIILNRQVVFDYRNKNYRVHPYGIAILLPKIYLVGKKDGSESEPSDSGYRSFLLHKIRDIYTAPESASIPQDFSLRQFLEQGNMDILVTRSDDTSYQLVLELDAGAQQSNLIEDLSESPISADQEIRVLEGNQYQLTATVRRTVQLRNWLTSLGAGARVVSPDVIREDLVSHLSAILQKNSPCNQVLREVGYSGKETSG